MMKPFKFEAEVGIEIEGWGIQGFKSLIHLIKKLELNK